MGSQVVKTSDQKSGNNDVGSRQIPTHALTFPETYPWLAFLLIISL